MKKKMFISFITISLLGTVAVEQVFAATTTSQMTYLAKKKKNKKIDEKGNKKFATQLKKDLTTIMDETGLTYNVEYTDTLIFIVLPQDLKYTDEINKQKVADALLTLFRKSFKTWAKKNNYKSDEITDFPHLYIEFEDGSTMAEENRFNGTMELK